MHMSSVSLHRRNVQQTINLGAKDSRSVALQSSDVSTGLTTGVNGQDVEADDFYTIEKFNPASGGARSKALAEDAAIPVVQSIEAYGGTATTAKTTAALGLVDIFVSEHNGANVLADITADGNVLSVRARVGGATLRVS